MSAPSAAASGNSGAQTGASNSDALASIITQVQPGQQPARAPNRPRKPQTRAPAVKPAARPAQQTTPAPSKQQEAISEKPKQPAPAPSPAAPTVKAPVVSEPTRSASPRKKRKQKPGFFESLLAFLTCSSPAGQEGNFRDGQKSREAPTLPKHGRKQTASTETKDVTPPTSSAAGVAASAPVTGSSGPPTPSVPAEPIDAAALASQEGLANTSREGVSLPRDETGDVLSGAVVPPGKEGGTPSKKGKRKSRASTPALATSDATATGTEEPEEVSEDEEEEEYAEEDEEDRLIMQGGMGIPVDEHGNSRPLLIDLAPSDKGRKCLVLDLDETLVHSSFKMIHQADFVVPVEIENQSHNVYVIKRPGVDQFLQKMGEIYEVVVFTASLSKYADPVLDHLDISRVVKHRLFRESCYNHRGNYVKDLSQLGRPISETIIIDNSPASYIFHPKNAVPVSSWFNDPHDTELTDLLGVLTDLADVPDVRGVLDSYLETDAGGFGLDQSMEQLSAEATSSAIEHSTLQHQASQQLQ